MINIPPVGSTCLVTFPKHFPKHSMTIKILDSDVKGDSFGTIKYQILSETEKRDGYKTKKVTNYKTTHFNHKTQEWNKVAYENEVYVRENGQYVNEVDKYVETNIFTDRFSIVEDLWFDQELTGRKVEILK